jgi:hypothetical protein
VTRTRGTKRGLALQADYPTLLFRVLASLPLLPARSSALLREALDGADGLVESALGLGLIEGDILGEPGEGARDLSRSKGGNFFRASQLMAVMVPRTSAESLIRATRRWWSSRTACANSSVSILRWRVDGPCLKDQKRTP